jgi:hypothetical protein
MWLLEHFCIVPGKDSLAGDLLEQFQQGRPTAWYWRQVMAAIQWRRHAAVFVFYAGISWYYSRLAGGPVPMRRSLDFIVMTVVLWSSYYLAQLLPGIWRAILVFLIICWTYSPLFLPAQPFFHGLTMHYSMVLTLVWINLAFYRRIDPPAYRMSLREMWNGDSVKQRARLISRLEQTISEEPDSQLRQAYEKALKSLRAKSM